MFRTKASTYAILAVLEVARQKRGRFSAVQAGEIANSLSLPGAYAAKVLTQLARANVLRSDRGPRGGFRLARPPDSINLLEIVEAVDGPIGAGRELADGLDAAGGGVRTVDQLFEEVVKRVRTYLRSRTLADLIEQADRLPSIAKTT